MMQKRMLMSALSLAFLVAWWHPANAENPGKMDAQLSQPFVTVNGEIQPVVRAEILFRDQLAQGAIPGAQLRADIRERMVNQALMAQAASKAGLEKLPFVQARIDLGRQDVLARTWQEQLLRGKQFSDEEMKDEYKRQVALLGGQELQIRHLFVHSEDIAKLLLDKVRSGTKLADLAAEYSQDAATREKGGVVDWSPEGKIAPELLLALRKTKKGSLVTSPVQTKAGWHVVQFENERPFTPPSMDAVKPQLLQSLAQQYLKKALAALRSGARIE